jgi:hypothetical protein
VLVTRNNILGMKLLPKPSCFDSLKNSVITIEQ